MDFVKTDAISLIYYLLPGFLAAWIYYSLTSHPRPSTFERVVQALIFTTVIQPFVYFTQAVALLIGTHVSIGTWSQNTSFAVSVLYATLIGFVFTTFANTGWFHSNLPDWMSRRTSFSSEWYSAFSRTRTYIYLHLNDGRRIYGWPEEWPDQPDRGHFILMNAAWILDDNERAPLCLIQRLLIPAIKVEFVEFEKEVLVESEEHLQAVDRLVALRESNKEEV